MTDTIQVVLDLDANQFVSGVNRAATSLGGIQNAVNRANRGIGGLSKSMRSAVPNLRDWVFITSAARLALTEVWRATVGWQVAILNMNGEIERSQTLLAAMGSAADGVVDPMTGMTAEMEHFLDLSANTPFSLNALTNAAVKFKTAGIDPVGAGFNALTDAVAAFGGTDETLKRASVAIQQMAGKGVVSMEELRQQLGEAVPDALKLMARAMGETVGGLTKRISLGQVEASSAITALLDEMERKYQGAALNLTQTWFGTIARLETGWQKFIKNIGNAGFDAAGQSVAEGLVRFVNSEKAAELAQQIGTLLTSVADLGKQFAKLVRDNLEPFKNIMIGISAIILGRMLSSVKFLSVALSPLAVGVTAAAVAFKTLSSTFEEGTLRVALGVGAIVAAGVQFNKLSSTITKVGFSFRALAGPIGFIVSLFAILALDSEIAGKKVNAALKRMKEGASLTGGEIETLNESIRSQRSEIVLLDKDIERLNSNEITLADSFLSAARSGEGAAITDRIELLESLNARRKQLITESNETEKGLETSQTDFFKREGERRFNQIKLTLAKETEEFRREYEERAKLIDAQVLAAGGENPALKKERLALQASRSQDTFNLLDESLKKQGARIAESVGDERKIRTQAYVFLAKQFTDFNNEKLEIAKRQAELEARQQAGIREAEIKSLKGYVTNLRKLVARERAKSEGGLPKVIELEELLKDKNVGAEVANSTRETVRLLSEELKKLKEATDLRKDSDKASIDIAKQLATANRDLENTFVQIKDPLATINKEVDKVELKYTALIERQKATAAGSADLRIELDELTKALNKGDAATFLLETNAAVREMTNDLLPEAERKTAAYINNREKEIAARVQAIKQAGDDVKLVNDIIAASNKKLALAEKGQISNREKDYKDFFEGYRNDVENAHELTLNWIDDFVNTFAEGLRTGQFEFGRFIESIISDLLKLAAKKALLALFEGVIGSFGAGAGATAASGANAPPGSALPTANFPVQTYPVPNAPQASRTDFGGITDGSFARSSYDRGFVSSQPLINVNNESATTLTPTSATTSFDRSLNQTVVDIFLEEANQGGSNRSSLRRALG